MKDTDKRSILDGYERVLQHSRKKQARLDGTLVAREKSSTGTEDASDEVTSEVKILGKEEEMKKLAQEKLEQMQRGEWIVQWKGKDVFNVRKRATELIKAVQTFSGLIGAAARLDPLHAGLAWAGVCVVLPVRCSGLER